MYQERSKKLLALALFAMFSVSFANIAAAPAQTEEAPDADTPEVAADVFQNWSPVGPEGGDIRVIAIDPRDKDRFYMSSLDGQIYTSPDGGHTWRLVVNLNKPDLILDNLFVDSRDSKIIYASGHRGTAPGGFFRTTDGGANWKEAKELKNEAIHAMTQSTADPNIIVVGAMSGVFISKNSGADWEKLQSPTMPVNVDSLATDPRSPNTIYAGTLWRPYKTTDQGKTWRLIKEGMIDDSDVFAITVDQKDPDHIISSACSGIYESTNGGELWKKIQGIPSQSRRTRDLLQHPSMPGYLYAATTEGFWMSDNAGKPGSWRMTTQRDLEINSIAVHPADPNRVLIATNNYGLMMSSDGGRNFVPANNSFTSRLTYFITPDIQQPNRLYAATHNTATGGGFFFISNDGGRTWMQGRGLDVIRVRAFVLSQDTTTPNLMYLGTNMGLFKSIDRGISWTRLVAPKPPAKKAVAKKTVKGKRPAPVAKTPPVPAGPVLIPAITDGIKAIQPLPGGGMLVGTDTGLYRALDPLKGWEKLPFGPGLSENVFAIHVNPARPETIWAGTSNSGVLVSRDSGKTWSKTGGADQNVPVSSIMSDPKRPDYIYVGTIQTFYLSRDNGQTWLRRGGNLPLGNFTRILINPSNTDEIILSSSLDTSGGIYLSTDAGNRWKRIDGSDMKLASRRFWAMAFDPQDPNRIYAATHSSGVYRIERQAATVGGM